MLKKKFNETKNYKFNLGFKKYQIDTLLTSLGLFSKAKVMTTLATFRNCMLILCINTRVIVRYIESYYSQLRLLITGSDRLLKGMTSDPMEVRDRFITNGVSVLILKELQINK